MRADDDLGGAHHNLELDQLRTRAADDDEPEAAAGTPLHKLKSSLEINREARSQQVWRLLDRCIDLEVEVVREARCIRVSELVCLTALHPHRGPKDPHAHSGSIPAR